MRLLYEDTTKLLVYAYDELLKDGDYTITETATSATGYNTVGEFKFTVKDGKITSVTNGANITGTKSTDEYSLAIEATNTKIVVSATINKVDIADSKELDVAIIEVYNAAGTKIDEWESVAGQTHTINNIYAYEQYTLKETTAPEGYKVAAETTFTVDIEGKITIIKTGTIVTADGNKDMTVVKDDVIVIGNEIRSVSIRKTDVTTDKPIDGAYLVVNELDANGAVVKKVDSWYSSATEDYVVSGLKANTTYQLVEETKPAGYEVAATTTFVLDEDGKVIEAESTVATIVDGGKEILLVEDKPINYITLYKTYEGGPEGTPSEMAKFAIYDNAQGTGTAYELKYESAYKNYSYDKSELIGDTTRTYYIVETYTPDGYVACDPIAFQVSPDGTITFAELSAKNKENDRVSVTVDSSNSRNAFVSVKNEWLTVDVSISKVDINGGAELEGAKLQLIDKDGKIVDEWTSTKTPYVIKGLTPGDKYTLKETLAPTGYDITTDTYFVLNTDGTVNKAQSTSKVSDKGVILVEDTKTVVDVKISKVDIADGKELEGATIQLIDKDGKVVDTWISTKEPHLITGLTPGDEYTLRETVAPVGYDIATDTHFVLNVDGTVDKSKTTSSVSDTGIILVEDEATFVPTPTPTTTPTPTSTPTPTGPVPTPVTPPTPTSVPTDDSSLTTGTLGGGTSSSTGTSTSTTTTTTTTTSTVKTGEEASVTFMVAILLMTAAGFVFTVRTAYKRDEE